MKKMIHILGLDKGNQGRVQASQGEETPTTVESVVGNLRKLRILKK